ncbi:MAG: hypothetical protein AAFX79_00165 [Planctomycetota bacterium]
MRRLAPATLIALATAAAFGQNDPAREHRPPPPMTDRDRAVLDALATLEIVRPGHVERLEHDVPEPHAYRDTPAAAEDLPTLRFRVIRTLESTGADPRAGASTEDLVTRSSEAVSMQPAAGGEAWLFTRNTAFPSRSIGYAIDLERRLILEHEDTDLRSRGIVRDWLDVLVLGFDLAWLDRCRPTGEATSVSGYEFRRYLHEPTDTGELTCEVWWSEELLLPLEVTLSRTADGATHCWVQRIEDLEVLPAGETPSELRPPARQRFVRTFQRMTLGDWYEVHFGCDCPMPGQGLSTAVRGRGAGTSSTAIPPPAR